MSWVQTFPRGRPIRGVLVVHSTYLDSIALTITIVMLSIPSTLGYDRPCADLRWLVSTSVYKTYCGNRSSQIIKRFLILIRSQTNKASVQQSSPIGSRSTQNHLSFLSKDTFLRTIQYYIDQAATTLQLKFCAKSQQPFCSTNQP